jgi:hypothetical protein
VKTKGSGYIDLVLDSAGSCAQCKPGYVMEDCSEYKGQPEFGSCGSFPVYAHSPVYGMDLHLTRTLYFQLSVSRCMTSPKR